MAWGDPKPHIFGIAVSHGLNMIMFHRMAPAEKPLRRARRTWRELARYIVHQRASPEAIARGMAIGLLVTFTPTVGIQILLTIVLATLFNANRLSAILPVWLTNVFTVPPTYAFTYWVGSFFFPREGHTFTTVRKKLSRLIIRHDFYRIDRHFMDFFDVCRDLFLPMMVGGLIVGAVAAAIGYPLTLRWVKNHRARRSERIRQRAFHLQRRRNATAEDARGSGLSNEPPPAGPSGPPAI